MLLSKILFSSLATGCEAMSGCLQCLAADYTNVKFCRILSSVAGLSKHFESSGVPALIIYRAGILHTMESINVCVAYLGDISK